MIIFAYIFDLILNNFTFLNARNGCYLKVAKLIDQRGGGIEQTFYGYDA